MNRWMKTYEEIPSLSSYIDETDATNVENFDLPIDFNAFGNLLAFSDSSSTISLSKIRKLLIDSNPNLINRYCSCQVKRSFEEKKKVEKT